MSTAEMGACFGQESEYGDQAKGERLVSLGLARGRVERWLVKANGGGWMEMPGDASPHERASVRAAGSQPWVRFPRPRPGPPPCSLATALGRAGATGPAF